MKSTDIIKQIKADGWYLVHVVGSHHQFKLPTQKVKVTVTSPTDFTNTPSPAQTWK